ncbi:hypothetical protein PsYK624_105530 [Phanerochaete sordida]|uniref:Uncharacterized protein n=1 Tax=Phanerochaete sordida TaxID=48140 RepID=A0A9P3GIV0_9APHY|nr:hypothetical protein PsYK624_105530 [Phanerochaete sordida]
MCLERPPLALSLNADPDSESDWTPVTTPASQYVQYLFSDTLQYYSGTVPFSPRAETVCKVIYIYPQPKTRIVKKCSRHAYIIKQDPRPSPPSGRLTQGANKSEMTYRAVGPQDAQNTPSRMWREQPRVVLGDSTNYVVYVPGTRETPQKLISVTCELVELSFSPHPTTLEISALIIMWMGLLLPLVRDSLARRRVVR